MKITLKIIKKKNRYQSYLQACKSQKQAKLKKNKTTIYSRAQLLHHP